jgi:hypothetical protein
VALVVVDRLGAGAAGVVAALGLVEEDELVPLPVGVQSGEVPVVVPMPVVAPVGDVVVTVSGAVTTEVVVGALELVLVLELDAVEVEPAPLADVPGRFGYVG